MKKTKQPRARSQIKLQMLLTRKGGAHRDRKRDAFESGAEDYVDPAIWPLLTDAMAKMPRDLEPDDDGPEWED